MRSATQLNANIDAFVAQHEGRPRQRTPEWFALRPTCLGGSEMAAIMTPPRSPYKTFADVVKSKAGLCTGALSVACWWGTLFESAIESFVELDCDTRISGTDISVPAPESSGLQGMHANSPDGYAVISLVKSTVWQISFDVLAGLPTKKIIALMEFKCPYSRRPNGKIPRHYAPQIWSGLALSPIASYGLYVDAVFRKCSMQDLGPSPKYDTTYHKGRASPEWGTPIAWGSAVVYAPLFSTQQIYSEYFGTSSMGGAHSGLVDFGDCSAKMFDNVMGLIDAGEYRAVHVGPKLEDGRGTLDIWGAIDECEANPPEGYFALGLIPWKLLEVDYVFLSRRAGFLAEVAPRIRLCLEIASQIRESPSPEAAYVQASAKIGPESVRWCPKIPASESAIQSLFSAMK